MSINIKIPHGFYSHRVVHGVNDGSMGFPPAYQSYPNAEMSLAFHAFHCRDTLKKSHKFSLGTFNEHNHLPANRISDTALNAAVADGLRLPFDSCAFEYTMTPDDPNEPANGVVILAEQTRDPETGANQIYTSLITVQIRPDGSCSSPFFYAQGMAFEQDSAQYGFVYQLDDRPIFSDMDDQYMLVIMHYPFIAALLALNAAKAAATMHGKVVVGPKGSSGKEARERMMFEYKVLQIDTDAVRTVYDNKVYDKTDRVQSRHERRGHMRTLKSGRVIYVRPCVINADKDIMKVTGKDYHLPAPSAN